MKKLNTSQKKFFFFIFFCAKFDSFINMCADFVLFQVHNLRKSTCFMAGISKQHENRNVQVNKRYLLTWSGRAVFALFILTGNICLHFKVLQGLT